MQNRDLQLETSGKVIGFYERESYILSNFSSFKVKWRGRTWMKFREELVDNDS